MTARSISRSVVTPLSRSIVGRLAPSELQSLINDLFGAGQRGLLFVPEPVVLDEQRLYKLSDFTDPVTADGDPVGGGQEVSGNDNHLTQGVSADRPTYGTDGSLHWLGFDGVGDNLVTSNYTGLKTVMLAVRRASLDNIVFVSNSSSTSDYFFVVEPGSTGSLSSGAGSPSIFVDGASVYTRGEADSATSDLGWHIFEAHGVDTSGWSGIKLGGYGNGTNPYDNPFESGALLVFDAADTPARDKARNYLAERYGITL